MTKLSQGTNAPGGQSPSCDIEINIESKGNVNIYNCSAPEPCNQPCPPCEECPPAQTATGACVPLALGAKPKQSRQAKLQTLLSKNPAPSALAASFIQLSRRFLAGRPPANPLEDQVFSALRSLPPELKGVLACALDSFDSLSTDVRDGLFLSTLVADINTPIEPGVLAEAVGQEIAQRASTLVFGDPNAVEQERPGRNRFFDTSGEENFDIQLRICRVNKLRTNEFAPPLGQGDYKPEELQQDCQAVLVDGKVELNCEQEVGNCPGNFLEGNICLRVPEVEAGQAVVLEGVNFINVDSTVRLVAQSPGTSTAEVETHVVGDIDTPLNEVINGVTTTIRDCRVHDRMAFRVPDDLAPGIYTCQIVMPNNSGIQALGNPILSNFQYLQVVPPATARFQVALDTMTAKDETSPAFLGSDEVGLSIVAAALLTDGTTSSLQVLKGNDGKDFLRFDDVDSGDSFSINRVLFTQSQNIIAMAMSINGYEIDSEDAFEKQVKSSMDVFVDILGKEWDFIKAAVTAAGGYQALEGLGLYGFIALGIAALLTLGIDAIIALWAPADPIMHDALGFTTIDLAALTSANFPVPSPTEFKATDDIKVNVTPLDKLPDQFSELREYHSDDEDSRYDLTLRYNRLA